MKAKHTPGPFEVSKDLQTKVIEVFQYSANGPDSWRHFFQVDPTQLGEDQSTEEMYANIRLLKAAPELLKALKRLVSKINLSDGSPDFDGSYISKIEALIDTATGEER